jgi:hypothetical protein
LSSFLSVVGNEGSNLTKIFADATGKGNTLPVCRSQY